MSCFMYYVTLIMLLLWFIISNLHIRVNFFTSSMIFFISIQIIYLLLFLLFTTLFFLVLFLLKLNRRRTNIFNLFFPFLIINRPSFLFSKFQFLPHFRLFLFFPQNIRIILILRANQVQEFLFGEHYATFRNCFPFFFF